MRKEFILGKKYRCVSKPLSSFIVGEVYPTYEHNSGIVSLLGTRTNANHKWCLRRSSFPTQFEEVKDDEETINVEVGDIVEYKVDPVFKYELIATHKEKAWITRGGRYYSDKLSRLTKSKDIRIIECAGGAVVITGEFVNDFPTTGDISVRTDISYQGTYHHYGKEMPQTPSQPH